MVISGLDAVGRPFCGPHCQASELAERRREIEPIKLRIRGAHGEERWLQVLIITTRAEDDSGTWLVHCALDADRTQRIEEFMTKVASRSSEPMLRDRRAQPLTRREREILRMLAEGDDLESIADGLCLSYATVRNHVQHILTKLGVHSIMEAVARDLIVETGNDSEE